jgi:release factor glutamine methyltransferase
MTAHSRSRTFYSILLSNLYKPLLTGYLRRTRDFSYRGIHIKILPGVFHPGFFSSTKILLGELGKLNVNNKTFLELGAGSGIISIVAAKKNGIVTASDISSKAIENVELNARMNNVQLQIILSDLFEKIPAQQFDFIFINPPYYKGVIKKEADHAWYAGEDFQYFRKLFSQLSDYMTAETICLMILSEECDVKTIQSIAKQNAFYFSETCSKSKFGERQIVFQIRKS